MTTQNLKYIGIAGCALAIIGAFLVWAKVSGGGLEIEIKGTDEDKDGTITLILAVLAAGAIWFIGVKPWVIWVALVASVLFLLVGIYDTVDIMGTEVPEGVSVSVGIGLWLTVLGGILATAATVMIKMNASKGVAPLAV
jgi:hypothetical protein